MAELINTGICIPIELHRLLRGAAAGRQRAAGGAGRASVSAIISQLIEQHWAELLRDAAENHENIETAGPFREIKCCSED